MKTRDNNYHYLDNENNIKAQYQQYLDKLNTWMTRSVDHDAEQLLAIVMTQMITYYIDSENPAIESTLLSCINSLQSINKNHTDQSQLALMLAHKYLGFYYKNRYDNNHDNSQSEV